MKISIFTSDHHDWLLKGFFHQWDKYARNEAFEIEVAGFTRPEFLEPQRQFYKIGEFKDYPIERWSDAVIRYLEAIPDELFLFMHEDYWMMRPVREMDLHSAHGYMMEHENVIRFDVAADRMFAKGARYIETWGSLDICEAKGAYSLSHQASIFRKSLLLEVMRKGETPWEAELNGSARLNQLPYRVVGSYQWPMMYLIAVNKGKMDRTGGWMFPARTLKDSDWQELDRLGYTTAPEVSHEHAL